MLHSSLRIASFVVVGLSATASQAAFFEDLVRDEAPGFELPQGVRVDQLPLRSQTTTVDVAGVIARIHLVQVWENAGNKPLEITYVFPTSTRLALHDLRLRINDARELRAEIRAKEQAKKIYDAARDAGKTAGLLEQQRPNAVTMRVANVMPGDRITVTVEASELVRSTDSVYELVLPQTLGPRFTGNAGSEEFVQNGYVSAKASTTKTNINLTLRSPVGIHGVGSPSHAIHPRFDGPNDAAIKIASDGNDVVADRDVILRWRLAGDKTETGVLLFRDKENDEHFFLLLGAPPQRVDANAAPPREVIFVVDVSGSMNGFPLETAKSLVRNLVGELRPVDRFNMVFFAGGNTVLGKDGSVSASRTNIANAMDALDRQRGGGGTQLLGALETTFALPRGDDDGVERARLVVVITDGLISAERSAFDLVRSARGDATVVSFGIGGSVNRQLIEGLAHAGGTESIVVVNETHAARAAEHFRAVASRPALTNIKVAFEGLKVSDLEPKDAPDLYPGRPLVMLGKFKGASSGRVVVTGAGLGGEQYRDVIPIEDNLERPSHAPLRYLWARERVARLADRATPTDAELAEVEKIGLRYRLLTERTSFVVVDNARRNTTGDVIGVNQPSVTPRGMDPGLSGLSVAGGGGLSTFGAGGLGSGIGRGSGSAMGIGSGLSGRSGAADLGGRSKGVASVAPGKVIYQGSLDRAEIQRVINRVMGPVKYCYEKELAREPTLAGKLVLTWTIAGDGSTKNVSVSQNTMTGAGGTATATCVSRVFQRLVFPKPAGGGQVAVTYPFIFQSPQ